MLSARNIHKRFGALEVLKGIDLDIADGKVTTIVGPSGAGKTTLLQILGTLSSPEAGGRVLYDGVDVTTLSDKKLSAFRNRNIGFVFQFHQLLPEFTLVENVAMPALIGGAAHRDAIGRAEALLDRLGLGDRASRAASASAPPWPAHWSIVRASSLPTSLRAASTRPTAHRCTGSSSSFATNLARLL